jgi:hypothetical protein
LGSGPDIGAENKIRENNPMHRSRALVGIGLFRFYEIDLTRRAKQGHDDIMAAGVQQASIRTHLLCRRPIGNL